MNKLRTTTTAAGRLKTVEVTQAPGRVAAPREDRLTIRLDEETARKLDKIVIAMRERNAGQRVTTSDAIRMMIVDQFGRVKNQQQQRKGGK